jgi:hypothetical protein
MSQAEIIGFPPNITLVWGGFNPDKTWSYIRGYYLVCFNNGIEWHYDIGRNIHLQQLQLDLQPPAEKPKKRRVTPKKKGNEPDKKTGTNN